jgi:hypothetical protein
MGDERTGYVSLEQNHQGGHGPKAQILEKTKPLILPSCSHTLLIPYIMLCYANGRTQW